ncbi:unnamed protein product [Dicrocoelium dendriticum]|nr:unnamed protein product [Dicrocoelium dendriticum]
MRSEAPPLNANLVRQYFVVQVARKLKKPDSSPIGWLITKTFFKHSSASLAAAAVEHCNLRPGQDVLEIGYGIGLGIQLAAKRVAPLTVEYHSRHNTWKRFWDRKRGEPVSFPEDGHVDGIDISDYMLKKASRLNRTLIKSEVVNLRLSSVEHLPLLANTVDACFHVNSFYFWESLPKGLHQIWRVLRPDGRLVTTFCPFWIKRFNELGLFRYARADPIAYALALEACGFDRIEWLKGQVWPGYDVPYDAIIAHKPVTSLLTSPTTSQDTC